MFIRTNLFSRYCSVFVLTLVVLLSSCTDLSETINSEVTSDQFFQTDEEFISALGDSYNVLSAWGTSGGWTAINEVATEEGIVTQKGTDWEDGGIWIRLQRHQQTYDDPQYNAAWTFLYSGVNNSNRLIFQFESLVESGDVDQEQAGSFISELKVLRAFYYYMLLDGFGNVPIITSFQDAPEEPTQPSSNFQEGRNAVFDFVEKEILENLDAISNDPNSSYGRVNQDVAHMILAKMYLNAHVYRDLDPNSAEYASYLNSAIEHADAIIDSGHYSLASDYSANFATNNSSSPENIFVVPYDKVFLEGFNLAMMTLHYQSQSTYDLEAQPWNGFAAMEEMYSTYIDPEKNPGPQGEVWGTEATSSEDGLNRIQGTQDARLSNFIVGPQYSSSGERLEDPGSEDADPNGPPLTFTPEIKNLAPNGLRQGGARIGKFEFASGANANLSNDYPIFRFADVLLMKAEALWRLNEQPGEALRLVNLVRQRAGVDNYSSLDATKILMERGREMFWEVTRRQDLIRFEGVNGGATRFNDPWTFKSTSDPSKNVFPIPRDQLEANTQLVQNPGYQG
ncbi:RagB/SusD family nutrient uptake outer membrane protein [Fodinibius sediminis]|uniref:Starch-binding associating with outer membrane n=1 Tax=Fodinibius sediminis TaxID=1214077 RepID=A0A521CTZ5_9BACT|nr:RagB/SusD family nutrient uptake outer membrane protein [Fodinibius sediminis]SMO62882.1 Starch-binding associating with outer membrane [Fodinibius sediminis]